MIGIQQQQKAWYKIKDRQKQIKELSLSFLISAIMILCFVSMTEILFTKMEINLKLKFQKFSNYLDTDKAFGLETCKFDFN